MSLKVVDASEAAGTELGSPFAERIAVNTGTVPVCPASRGQRAGLGWARCRPNGPGRGGAAVVLRAGESPCAWGRAAAVPGREGGCNAARYFKHAVCKHTLGNLAHFAWWRVIRWLRTLHRWRWKDVRRAFTTPEGRWKPVTADGIELFNMAAVPVTRYRYRGSNIPSRWVLNPA